MKPWLILGLEPTVKDEVVTRLRAQGWNVVEGEPVADAIDNTVFIASVKPAEPEPYNIIEMGVNMSPGTTAEAIVQQITPGDNTEDVSDKEPVIAEQPNPTQEMGDNTETQTQSEQAAEAEREQRHEREKQDRARTSMAFLLS